jgi:hypothetical protein
MTNGVHSKAITRMAAFQLSGCDFSGGMTGCAR